MGSLSRRLLKPVHPLEGWEFDGFDVTPWSTSMDDLRLVEAIDRLGEDIVVRVAEAADRRA